MRTECQLITFRGKGCADRMPAAVLRLRRLTEQAAVAGSLAAGRPPGVMSHIGKIGSRGDPYLPHLHYPARRCRRRSPGVDFGDHPLAVSDKHKLLKALLVDVGLMQRLSGMPADAEHGKSNLWAMRSAAGCGRRGAARPSSTTWSPPKDGPSRSR